MVSELKMERNTQLPAATRRTSNPLQNSASVTVRSSRNSVLTDHSVFTSNAAGAGPALNLACTATEMAAPAFAGFESWAFEPTVGRDFFPGSCATASPRNPRRRRSWCPAFRRKESWGSLFRGGATEEQSWGSRSRSGAEKNQRRGGWPSLSHRFFLSRSETMGAPLLRFLQGRVPCCRYHGILCLPVCIALTALIICTLSPVPVPGGCLFLVLRAAAIASSPSSKRLVSVIASSLSDTWSCRNIFIYSSQSRTSELPLR